MTQEIEQFEKDNQASLTLERKFALQCNNLFTLKLE
jgi:hypothetical protein